MCSTLLVYLSWYFFITRRISTQDAVCHRAASQRSAHALPDTRENTFSPWDRTLWFMRLLFCSFLRRTISSNASGFMHFISG